MGAAGPRGKHRSKVIQTRNSATHQAGSLSGKAAGEIQGPRSALSRVSAGGVVGIATDAARVRRLPGALGFATPETCRKDQSSAPSCVPGRGHGRLDVRRPTGPLALGGLGLFGRRPHERRRRLIRRGRPDDAPRRQRRAMGRLRGLGGLQCAGRVAFRTRRLDDRRRLRRLSSRARRGWCGRLRCCRTAQCTRGRHDPLLNGIGWLRSGTRSRHETRRHGLRCDRRPVRRREPLCVHQGDPRRCHVVTPESLDRYRDHGVPHADVPIVGDVGLYARKHPSVPIRSINHRAVARPSAANSRRPRGAGHGTQDRAAGLHIGGALLCGEEAAAPMKQKAF